MIQEINLEHHKNDVVCKQLRLILRKSLKLEYKLKEAKSKILQLSKWNDELRQERRELFYKNEDLEGNNNFLKIQVNEKNTMFMKRFMNISINQSGYIECHLKFNKEDVRPEDVDLFCSVATDFFITDLKEKLTAINHGPTTTTNSPATPH